MGSLLTPAFQLNKFLTNINVLISTLVYKSPHPLLHFNGEDNTERAKHEVESVF
jgi:hypothetical protein